ncbi:MAG: ABC transporter ATP-binding protein [Euryarchaeota archaeon]|nr:ABC transporter ATP-binding protein [Euryarchaeota archaeon]
MLVFAIKNLQILFPAPGGEIHAVDTVNLELNANDKLALIGESGCGKTVLAHSILRLLHGTTKISGEILYRGTDVLSASDSTLQKIRGKEIGMIIQNPGLSLNPVLSIGKQIAESCIEREKMSSVEAFKYAEDMLKMVGFSNPAKIASSYPHQLSGGMAQRAVIALGLTLNPQMLIADEPTKSLDEKSKREIIDLLIEMSKDKTLLMITHDLEAASCISNRVMVMYAAELIEEGPTEEIMNNPRHPYTRGFMNAQPKRGLKPIPGISPSLLKLPEGCRFHPRCSYALPKCKTSHPELIDHNGHKVRCHACH